MTESEWILRLRGHYPCPSEFFPYPHHISIEEGRQFASLWLAEGIPFAFGACPGAFVLAREQLATELDEEVRQIGITGSARLGYSLRPDQFGAPFRLGSSDVDLFIVSNKWYVELLAEMNNFKEDFEDGKISPRTSAEARFWPDNILLIPNFRRFGFIDENKIPSDIRYPKAVCVKKYVLNFKRKINSLANESIISCANARIYKDWNSAMLRIAENIRHALVNRR